MAPVLGEEERKFAQRRAKAVVEAVATPNIGPEVGNALLDFFEESHNRDVVADIFAAGVAVPTSSTRRANRRLPARRSSSPAARSAVARRGQGPGRGARRQGRRLGLGQDRPRRRRARRRLEAQEGGRARHRGDRRSAWLDMVAKASA
jgi:NAD-dependent DNA ligase